MLPVFGLFHKRIEGDDALLTLARKRFCQADMAPEFYCGSAEDLRHQFAFLPWPSAPVVVHLPRGLDLLHTETREWLLAMAAEFGSRVRGFVVHDQPALMESAADYENAVRLIDAGLESLPAPPFLFIEYASMLPFDDFYRFFESVRDTVRTSTCLDIGHLGVRQVQKEFAGLRPGSDISALKDKEYLSRRDINNLTTALERARPEVIRQVGQFCGLGKPLHFHLHDAHPLWDQSPFGVCDHLSFFQEILTRDKKGRGKRLPLLYGPKGLKDLVDVIRNLPLDRATFSLEIHPTADRQPLDDAEDLFSHWRDKTNAETMNAWLQTLQRNRHLLLEAIDQQGRPESASPGEH